MLQHRHDIVPCRKRNQEQIADKKLKGRMQHTERLNSEAAVAAAKTDEWLLPAEAGTLEAEGMERTWRFSQVCLSARLAKHLL